MRRLAPPLNVIEAKLFDPSPDLVRRWIDGDPALPEQTRAALDADPDVKGFAEAWRAAQAAQEHADLPPAPSVPIPAHIESLIASRVAAASRRLDTRPRPGLILRIDRAQGPKGPVDWDLPEPLAVLLSEPTEHPDVWYGYLMAGETDYASHWDLVLEECDAPCDPMAAMVQAWNPVHVYCPGAGAALGELGDSRLAAVRDLAVDLLAEHPDPADAEPGRLVRRTTTGGHVVLTGTPLGGGEDPRWRYHELYFAAADFLRDLARLALTELAPSVPWWRQVLTALEAAAGQWGLPWEPVPELALGPEPGDIGEPMTWRLGDLLEIQLLPSSQDDALQIHLSLKGQAPLTLSLELDGDVRQAHTLDSERSEADLFAGTEDGLVLKAKDVNGNELLSVQLPGASGQGEHRGTPTEPDANG